MTEIRAALDSAFEKSEPSEAPAPMETGAPIEAVGVEEGPPPGELASPEPAPKTTGPAKDPATGKFVKPGAAPAAPAPKPVVTALGAPAQSAGTPEATPAPEAPKPPAPTVKAPQSWKPEAREKWAALPPEVQAEVARVDREVRQTMQSAAEARKGWDAFRETVAPYESMIRAEGGEPLKAVGNLLQTAAALRTAPPAHKAQVVARLIQQYGVDVGALDAVLAGQAPQSPAQGAAPPLDPEALVQQTEQRILQRLQTRQQQAVNERARADTEAFISSGEAEFLDDVRDLMANMLDSAGRSGIALTLQDAYTRACNLHPEVSRVMAQRQAATAATATQAATQRSRAAASSVKSQPAAAPAAQGPTDLRSLLEANFTRASGR